MRVLVTGSKGLVGSAIKRYVEKHGSQHHFMWMDRSHGDLTDPRIVRTIFAGLKPEYVIHTAAKVGGIGGNMAGHADYFLQNILMNANLINECHNHGVQKLLAFSSVCVFPDDLAVMREDLMHNGPVYPNNFAYGYAKRMVDVQIRACKSQFGHTNWCSIIPGNIYGPSDLYNLTHGHVVPSLIHKIYNAKQANAEEFEVWGDGKSLREFLFVDDLAEVLVQLLEKNDIPERLIVSGMEQHSIRQVVHSLARAADFKGSIKYDLMKPNGQRNRQSDLTLLKTLFPEHKQTPLETGLKISYDWFAANYPNVRL